VLWGSAGGALQIPAGVFLWSRHLAPWPCGVAGGSRGWLWAARSLLARAQCLLRAPAAEGTVRLVLLRWLQGAGLAAGRQRLGWSHPGEQSCRPTQKHALGVNWRAPWVSAGGAVCGECDTGDVWVLLLSWVTRALQEDSLPEFAGSCL